MLEISRIMSVAAIAREEFASKLVERELLKELCDPYAASIDDMEAFLDRADSFPLGCCGLASIYLRHSLGEGEVKNGTYLGVGHTVLRMSGLVTDITADQFGGPKVYVGPLRSPWALSETR